MKNTYEITVTDSDGLLYACTYKEERYTMYQIPTRVVDSIGHKYMPCHVVCACVDEGWHAEKDFS